MSQFLRDTGSAIFFTEIICERDPRAKNFTEAKRKEIEGLIKRGTFKIVLREEIGEHPNIIPSRFVLAIKKDGSDEEILKARFVLGGHRDKNSRTIVHNASTLKQSSIRMLLALAAIIGFNVWSINIKQAYLRSACQLNRDVFIKPNVLELKQNELLRIVMLLYGLADSGDYWGETLTRHHLDKLRMKQTNGDFSLFFKILGNKLTALSGTYVDGIIRAGDQEYLESSTRQTLADFESKEPSFRTFTFTGLQVSQDDTEKTLCQEEYIKCITILKDSESFDTFHSMRDKLAWVANTRPDISCAISMASTVRNDTFGPASIKELNRISLRLKYTSDLSLKFPQLDLDSLRLTVSCDASFNNNEDHTSQLSHIILLSDASESCSVLQFSSHKSRRVTRSTMAAETFAFAHAFDSGYTLKAGLERILGKTIPILMLTDSQALFDVLTRAKHTT